MKDSKWIPCNEKLPESNTKVLAQWILNNWRLDDSGKNFIDILSLTDSGEWWGELGEPNGSVVAWMPLPEPYKGEQTDAID